LTNEGSKQPGYIYQEYKDFLWNISNNNISYGLGNIGIGTTTESLTFTNGALTVTGGVGIGGNLNIGGNMSIVGNLTINGTTTTVNSNTVLVNDPIITLGSNTINDVKDRGIDFNWYNGSIIKKGFIGLSQANNKFIFLSDASSNNDVYYGTSTTLEAQKYIVISDTSSNPGFSWSNNSNTGIYQPSSNTIGFTTDGIEKMRILNNGNVGIGTNNPQARLDISGNIYMTDGTSDAPNLTFRTDNDTGIYRPGSNILGFVTGGSERMRIDASGNTSFTGNVSTNGNVGIGTNNPQAKLHVEGYTKISQTVFNNAGRPMCNQTGGILQVLSYTIGATSVDMSASGQVFSLSITPSTTFSKILIIATVQVQKYTNATGYVQIDLYRGATKIVSRVGYDVGYNVNIGAKQGFSTTFVDSPATTSSIQYYIYSDHTNATGTFNYLYGGNSITLMEIAV